MIHNEGQLARLEEHLLSCPGCVDRTIETADYIDLLRVAIIGGDFDL
jgi:hypothetical protein